MGYAQLVMVHYYVHKPKKSSQWLEIDEWLSILRSSSESVQHMSVFISFIPTVQVTDILNPFRHARLILEKDKELFSHGKNFADIPKSSLTVPLMADVQAALTIQSSQEESSHAMELQ